MKTSDSKRNWLFMAVLLAVGCGGSAQMMEEQPGSGAGGESSGGSPGAGGQGYSQASGGGGALGQAGMGGVTAAAGGTGSNVLPMGGAGGAARPAAGGQGGRSMSGGALGGGGSAQPATGGAGGSPPVPPSACKVASGALPVLPCLQGFGVTTPAGRGGKILRVTNLNDSGPGSLRAAVEDSGKRVVVFETSGTIKLIKPLKITNPLLTIAGQTAPSPGITLRDSPVSIRTSDLLIQHLRFRLGTEGSESPDTADATQLLGNTVHHVVLDHCSFSWGIDETLSLNYEPHDVTLSSVIVSESLSHAGHPEFEHSKGLLFGNNTKNVVVMKSLLAHNVDRNPFIKGGAEVVVTNNVFYNWGKSFGARLGSSDSSTWPIKASIVGNVYIKGVNSPSNSNAIAVHDKVKVGTALYHTDNLAIGVPLYLNEAPFDPLVKAAPIWPPALSVIAAKDTESEVYAHAGARPRDRDSVDARIVNETRTRTGKVIDKPSEVGGWPTLGINSRAFVEPANPNSDDDGDGYTNLEAVLHKLAAALE